MKSHPASKSTFWSDGQTNVGSASSTVVTTNEQEASFPASSVPVTVIVVAVALVITVVEAGT